MRCISIWADLEDFGCRIAEGAVRCHQIMIHCSGCQLPCCDSVKSYTKWSAISSPGMRRWVQFLKWQHSWNKFSLIPSSLGITVLNSAPVYSRAKSKGELIDSTEASCHFYLVTGDGFEGTKDAVTNTGLLASYQHRATDDAHPGCQQEDKNWTCIYWLYLWNIAL